MVAPSGFDPPSSGWKPEILAIRRRGHILVEPKGIEPLTFCLPDKRSPNWAKAPNLTGRLHPSPSSTVQCATHHREYFYKMVGNVGFEPTISWPQTRRIKPDFPNSRWIGRGSRIWTDDHLSPRQVRYQAALYPVVLGGVGEIRTHGTIARTTPFQGVTIGLSVTTPWFGAPAIFLYWGYFRKVVHTYGRIRMEPAATVCSSLL